METTLTSRADVARDAAGIRAEEFDELVRRNQRRIYRLLLAMVRDPDLADTLAQECFLRAFEKRGSFRGESSAATWLVRIAVNLARDHAKNRRSRFWRWLVRDTEAESPAEAVPASAPSPECALAARQEAAAVWAVVETLPPQQRAVFVLRFAEEMSLEEIARALDVNTGTVKSHLHRALSALRQELRKREARL